MDNTKKTCRVLSLDGGDSLGFYTLGVLREFEATLANPIHQTFDLIFGTSTGAIIASLLALGRSVGEVYELYKEHVPEVMKARGRSNKSKALETVGQKVFGDLTFDEMQTGVGVVSTKWELETPMIFKSSQTQAHGRRSTFVAGFGCKVADAVQASCAAFPIFEKKTVTTSLGDTIELIDGGYCANNPTLYALADATVSLGFSPDDCRVLSIGCGQYPRPKYNFARKALEGHLPVSLLQKTLQVNTASMAQLGSLLFPNVPLIRISDTFSKPELATDFVEHNLDKLNLLRQQGAASFALRERDIQAFNF